MFINTKHLIVIGILTLLYSKAIAQAWLPLPMQNPTLPLYHAPAAHTYGVGNSLHVRKGTYQTLDGVWHEAKITLVDDGIWIQDIHDHSEEPEKSAVPFATLRLVTFRKDTLEILSKPADLAPLVEDDYLGRQKLQAAVFVSRCVKGSGLELLRCPTGHRGVLELVRQQNGLISIVPRKQKLFQEYALALVGDCPQLRQGIETGIYQAGMIEPLLRQYIRWKQIAQIQAK